MSSVEIVTDGGASVVEITASPAQVVEVIAPGPKGDGVPEGGATAQVLRKAGNENFNTEWHSLVKADVGLPNVDNTSDADKPVSTAQAAALDTKEPSIAVGTEAQYWTGIKTWRSFAADVRATLLTGLSTVQGTVVTAAHSVLEAIGFLQKQASDNKSAIDTHVAAIGNVHGLTRADLNLDNVLNVAQIPASEKGQANGVATLDAGGKVPSGQLPSYVDDVLEYPNLAAFPATGSAGIIYIAINGGTAADPSRQYRWSGTQYVENFASPGTTDNVVEGATNLYFTDARVRTVPLTGLDTSVAADVIATDTALSAFGKLQRRAADLLTSVGLKANAANAALTGTATAERLDVGNVLKLPEWTTATRPANALGRIGYNTDLQAYEGYSNAGWSSIGGGAKGAPGNAAFYENDAVITGSYTITTGRNAMSAGPITINDGVVVTVPDGSVWTIV